MLLESMNTNIFLANSVQTSESINVSRTFILNEKAISSLMRFAVEYDYMTEQIWQQLLKILNSLDTAIDGQDGAKEQKGFKFTQLVENSPYFARFIERFFMVSIFRYFSLRVS
jgi:hypothetical protein